MKEEVKVPEGPVVKEEKAEVSLETIGKLMFAVIRCETKELYRKGMTKEQFAEKVFPGMDMRKAPNWAHKLLDFLWDLFTK